jgi:HlyD family secretion protein
MAKKKSNPTRRILILIGVLLVLFIVVAVGGRALGIIGGNRGGIQVETAKAEKRDITEVVTASGRVQPETEVKISPDVSGEIIYLGVVEGQQVDKGTLLIRIRPDFYDAQVEKAKAGVSQAQAGLSRAKADLLNAELEMERVKELHERNVVPQAEFDRAKTTVDVAKANYDAAQYQVEAAMAAKSEAVENLAKTRIYSPMNGTVSMLNVELGERVVGTVQMAGTEMLRIARLDQMEVEAEVNENDVVNIALGDTARIEVDAYPGRAFRGVVTEIANSARIAAQGTQEQVTNFPVKVRILDTHNADKAPGAAEEIKAEEVALPESMPQFRPGMSSTVDVYTDFVGDCVSVPIQSVTVRDFNQIKGDVGDEGEADDDNDGTPAGDDESGDSDEGSDSGDDDMEEGTDHEDEFDEDGGMGKEDLRKVLFVVRDGEAKMVEVETGIADVTHIQITSGLEEGEEVVIGPYSAISRTLSDGDKVRTKNGTKS